MSNITVTVEETGAIVVTTSTTIGNAATAVSFDPSLIPTLTASNVQDALHQIADQKFVQSAAPAVSDVNLQEGDLWYNTTDNKLMVYRNTTWEEITLDAQLSESSGTSEYTDVTLNGGYF